MVIPLKCTESALQYHCHRSPHPRNGTQIQPHGASPHEHEQVKVFQAASTVCTDLEIDVRKKVQVFQDCCLLI